MNKKQIFVTCISFCLVAFMLNGCSRRALTKPRSEIISQASSSGLNVRSVEEDRAFFEAEEKKNRERLLALVKTRAAGKFRDKNYRVGPGDEVEFAVFDVPELNLAARVRQSGNVFLPLIGAVDVVGKTESEVQDAVAKRLSTYVKNPQVSVFISNYGSQKVAVMGAVREPGTYPLKKGTNSLMELVGEAGGLSEKSGSYLNFVPAELSGIDAGSDVESRAMLSLASQEASGNRLRGIEISLDMVLGTSGGIPLEIPVRGGDMVVIPEAGSVQVDGEVEKRGNYNLGRRMTLLGALAASGGLRYSAKVDEVEVVRQIGGEKVHLVVNLEDISQGANSDVLLKNGDIVRVPSDSGKRMSEDTFKTISDLLGVGVSVSPVN